MRKHRYVIPQEPDYKALAEDLSTQLHILKHICIRMHDEEQNRQHDTITGHRFWPSLCHQLFHRARQQ